jgi:hypothetical protein
VETPSQKSSVPRLNAEGAQTHFGAAEPGRRAPWLGGGRTAGWRLLLWDWTAVILFFVLQLVAGGAESSTERPAGLAAPSAAQNRDEAAAVEELLRLSLEELYNLEIVQPNVLGGHTHPAGQKMVGYRFMFMNMEGYREGTRELRDREVLRQYPVVHTRMTMEEHMLELMYAPTDRLTLMAMLPYKFMAMDHLATNLVTRGQVTRPLRFTQRADGVGDVEVMGLCTLLGNIKQGGHRVVANAGVSFPTGSIDARDYSPLSAPSRRSRLEYPMQPGSGTYELLPGLTYLGEARRWSWGAQGLARVRLGANDHDYRFGNQYRLTAWGAYGFTDWFAPFVRLEGRWWGNLHGADPESPPNSAWPRSYRNPEADPDQQAGTRLDVLFGLSLYAPKGTLKGSRITLEGGWPVHEDLDGPQLQSAWQMTVAWTYAF